MKEIKLNARFKKVAAAALALAVVMGGVPSLDIAKNVAVSYAEAEETQPVIAKENNQNANVWTEDDFVFRRTESPQLIISVDGFSAKGAEKAKTNKNLVLPATYKGEPVTHTDGVAANPAAISFANKGLTSLTIPQGYVRISPNVFEKNNFKELFIPKSVKNIHKSAFQENKELTKVVFEKNDADGTRGIQIDAKAFYACNISTLEFQGDVNEIGGGAFAENKIEILNLPKNGINVIGYQSFADNPLVKVNNLNPAGSYFEYGVFMQETKKDPEVQKKFVAYTLKNVSFDNFNSKFEVLPAGTFFRQGLKSLEIPANIVKFTGQVQGAIKEKPAGEPFGGNKGWYDGDKKVALYRLKSENNKLVHGSYVTDNAVADGKSYVFNPVLVKFDMVNAKGETVTNISENFTVKRTRNGKEEEVDVTKAVDSQNFKIGDIITITPKTEDKKLKDQIGNLTQVAKSFVIKLNPEVLDDKYYGDGYEVGYKAVNVSLTHETKRNIDVKVVWKDANNSDLSKDNQPNNAVKLQLTKDNGKEVADKTLELKKADEWVGKFKELDKQDASNKDIVYGIKVPAIEGYTSKIEGDQVKGFVITYTKTSAANDSAEKKNDEENKNETVTPAPTPTPTPTTPSRPSRPSVSRTNIPNPNDAASPSEITVIDENGVPLGNYKKQAKPDGTMEYVLINDEEVPLGTVLPKTGDDYAHIYVMLGLLIAAAGMGIAFANSRARKKER